MKIILGSQSPRRKEILSYFSLPFKQVSPQFDEEAHPFEGDPEEYSSKLSRGKAQSLSNQYPDAIIITADTIVYRKGKIYGKPANENEAFTSLKQLVGKWHTVYTAVTLQRNKEAFTRVESTRVLFNSLTDNQIRHYISHTDCADKAGGYAIQMAGGIIVKKIDGCYYNVMGLPINSLEILLKQFEIELWDYL